MKCASPFARRLNMRKQRLGILMAAAASVMGPVPIAAAQAPQQLPPAPALQGRPALLLAPAGAQIARAEDRTDVSRATSRRTTGGVPGAARSRPRIYPWLKARMPTVVRERACGSRFRGEHMGTTFAYRFRDRLGAEPDEIDFRY